MRLTLTGQQIIELLRKAGYDVPLTAKVWHTTTVGEYTLGMVLNAEGDSGDFAPVSEDAPVVVFDTQDAENANQRELVLKALSDGKEWVLLDSPVANDIADIAEIFDTAEKSSKVEYPEYVARLALGELIDVIKTVKVEDDGEKDEIKIVRINAAGRAALKQITDAGLLDALKVFDGDGGLVVVPFNVTVRDKYLTGGYLYGEQDTIDRTISGFGLTGLVEKTGTEVGFAPPHTVPAPIYRLTGKGRAELARLRGGA